MEGIWTICNTGLGSSYFVEMNIQDILNKYNKNDQYFTCHGALYDVDWSLVDIAVVARDIIDLVPEFVKKVVLNSIVDLDELETKLLEVIG
ncbi:MAG: PTS sugar transporter subunit IIB [Lachnospiraceae bacterium]|nr:PTS sugar transporter subunit IIB [Lachnospiraceae bacterium]